MAGTPTISVIIPAFNAAGTIGDTLRSLAPEKALIGEVILVDDSSTDGTSAIASDVASALGLNLRLISASCRDSGKARNFGLDATVGEWVYFIDADDCVEPGGLQRLHDAVGSSSTVNMAVGGFRRVTDGYAKRTKRPGRFSTEPNRNAARYISGELRSMPVGSVLVRSDLVGKTRFPGAMPYDEDTVFWTLLLMKARVVTVSMPIMTYRLATDRANRRFSSDPVGDYERWRHKLGEALGTALPVSALRCREGIVALKIARVCYAMGEMATARYFLSIAGDKPIPIWDRIRVLRYRLKVTWYSG